MNSAEAAFFVTYWALAVAAIAWVTRKAWRYARGRVDASEKLGKEGWILVGFDFIQGPIMVPPEAFLPPHLAEKWREESKRKATGGEP